ncbi:FHF complex subunit HOOK-interacting protein 1A-like [Acipenser ruthenus]|uniref:FHF complex subunit HOOK-interacting protein 1A-like n=1 Tax=Acipenser ruthenus TaxID=7906 RepID=UPI002741E7BD|nr:FHF complex subunit HOOK-interacting protein 1A-like [Acipenser ruthenus]XP_033891667.3 FHF complex subunit HOOK-interacting protein 1A-like [Acipenser ruthenus]XP_033891671.3 FHF complex subunit HOOK-interacting protein 1A-like [Acipenser ruthenus]XP_033891672.3 FHF complex subunit HOOK-interacting protein 1A-like [Acipenser ruthenus]XP_058884795.1 FHF complex subunit HOOK-interacting protein 1A-like [Acipenser ruthenus]XP_058884798.1 FHF complex subunit HOOK-interacting protein 1A-like [A
MASLVARANEDNQSLILKGVDPETCMIVFKNHWAQVLKILEKHDPLRSTGGFGAGGGGLRFGPIPGDEASAVQNYVEHMLLLLMEEESGQVGSMGPILEFVVTENVMEKLFLWSLRREFTDDMKIDQLKMYEMLVVQSRQPLLHHKPVLKPLMMLLSSCSGTATPAVEAALVILLNQLCSILAKDSSILELFFHTSEDQGAANFLIFSLLIPFIHREGIVGQQARDALLFIMSLSAENHVVAKHIAENTYFCPVLATGLSGLYSSLPAKLEVHSEEWHCLQREDWILVPALVQFMNSLEFCNAVIQVAHPTIRTQLVNYIYNGFLVPVLAPALHKLTLEEVMTTTAYLELFLRSVTEPALLQTFLSFILLHQHENVHILDTLVSRINTPFQLGTVSLSLFKTLIGLHCEDVMLQLILRYLIPCNHMMLSQRRVVRERDCYSVSAAKILALTPSCISPVRSIQKHQDNCILWSKGNDSSQSNTKGSKEEQYELDSQEYAHIVGCQKGMDVSYLHYLYDARNNITRCIKACRVWSAPYDGENPPPERLQLGPAEEGGKQAASSQRARLSQVSSGLTSTGEKAQLLELEWDDSYDTGMSPGGDGDLSEGDTGVKEPMPIEPPRHIQEMRKNAIMLIKGSYIEESDFQDDVMVYNLIAQRDAQDATEHIGNSPNGSEKTAPTVPKQQSQPLCNGLTATQNPKAVQEQNKKNVSLSREGNTVSSNGKLDDDSKLSEPDHNSNLRIPSMDRDDLISQYDDLLKGLGANSGGPVEDERAFVDPVTPTEEDDMDFNAFSDDMLDPERLPSPFGPKSRAVYSVSTSTRIHGAPFTGPFVSVLLSRLENMLENSLHVNLLLTEIIAQLAAYPQPLLRSFLLNTNMVFQPSVRSLYQVLAAVKNQIEQIAATKKDIPALVTEAQQYFLSRDDSKDVVQDPLRAENGQWVQDGGANRAQLLPSNRLKKAPPLPKIPSQMRNVVFATVLYTEFLKELAAVAQEHTIVSYISTEK